MASDPGTVDSGGVCSICIEAMATGGDRSTAQLFCGHVFHLDCIGSAFNVKGEMQCPNCRKVEKGNWRFAKGGRSYSDVNLGHWIEEEFDFAPDVPLGFGWCPFGRPLHAPSSSEGLDSSSTNYHAFPGFPPGMHPENMVRNALDICPYVAYFQIFHPSSASSHISSGNHPSNGTAFRHRQSRRRRSTDARHSHNHHNQESTYDGWNQSLFVHGPPYSHSIGAGQASTQAPSLRSMSGADDPLSQVRPYHGFDQSSGPRSGTSASSNVSPDASDNLQEHQNHYESWNGFNDSIFSSIHQSGNSRSLGPIGRSNHSNNPGYQLFGPGGSHHYAWDGAPFPSAPPMIADDSEHRSGAFGPIGGPHQFWYRHDLERTMQDGRTESSSYGQYTDPHIHHFI